MKKTCLLLAIALTIPAFIDGTANAVSDVKACSVPTKLTGEAMGPLIENPKEFLRTPHKETHTIRNFKTIKSEDFSDGYFVAAEIVEIASNSTRGIGIWFAPEWYAMPGLATKYSTLMSAKIGRTTWSDSGNGYKIKKTVSKKSHGYTEIMDCFK